MANKIQIKFEAIGDKALKRAILELAKAQATLENNTKNLNTANKALASANNKASTATKNHARSQKLIRQRVEKNVAAFGQLQSTIAVYRNKLLLAAFAVTAFRSTIGSLLNAYSIQESAERQLAAVLGKRSEGLLSFASAQQQVTMFGDEVTIQAMAQTAAFLKDEEQIKEVITASQDLATLFGWDLNTAAQLLTKTIASSTNALQRYGIEVEGAVGSTERFENAVGAVNKVAGGLSQEMEGTYQFAASQLSNAFGDLKETLGEELAPAIATIAKALKVFVETVNFENLKRLALTIGVATLAMKGFSFAMAGAFTKGKMYVKGIKAMTTATKTLSRVLKMAAWFWVVDFLLQTSRASTKAKSGFSDVTEGITDMDTAINQLNISTGGVEESITSLEQKLETLEFQKEWGKGWQDAMELAKSANEGFLGASREVFQDAIADYTTYPLIAGIDRIDITDIFKFDDKGNITDFTAEMHKDIEAQYGKHYNNLDEQQKANIFRSKLAVENLMGYYESIDFGNLDFRDANFLDFRWDESFNFDELDQSINRTKDMLRRLGVDIREEIDTKVKVMISLEDKEEVSKRLEEELRKATSLELTQTKLDTSNFGERIMNSIAEEIQASSFSNLKQVTTQTLVDALDLGLSIADFPEAANTIKEQIEKATEKGVKSIDKSTLIEIIKTAFDLEAIKLDDKLKPLAKEFENMFEDLTMSESQSLNKQLDVYNKQVEDFLIDMLKVVPTSVGESAFEPLESYIVKFNRGLEDSLKVDPSKLERGKRPLEQYFNDIRNLSEDFNDGVDQYLTEYADLLQTQGIGSVNDWKQAILEWYSSSTQTLEDNANTVENLIKKYTEKTNSLSILNPAIQEYESVIKDATDITEENKKQLLEAIKAYYEEKSAVDKTAESHRKLNQLLTTRENTEKTTLQTLLQKLSTVRGINAADLEQGVNVSDLISKNLDLQEALIDYTYVSGDYVDSQVQQFEIIQKNRDAIESLKEVYKDNAEMTAVLDDLLQGVNNAYSELAGNSLQAGQSLSYVTNFLNSVASAADAAAWSGQHMGRAIEDAIKRMASQIVAKATIFTAFYGLLGSISVLSGGGFGAGAGSMLGKIFGSTDFLRAMGSFIFHDGGHVQGYSTGGMVRPMSYHSGGGVDDVPAVLQEGEFVMQKSAVDSIGLENLNRMNRTGRTSGGMNIVFSNNVLSKDFIEEEAIPMIKDAVRRGADLGIS